VTHLVIAALLGDRPVQRVADEIVYPVLACAEGARRRTGLTSE
jgi:hypothetical protein